MSMPLQIKISGIAVQCINVYKSLYISEGMGQYGDGEYGAVWGGG